MSAITTWSGISRNLSQLLISLSEGRRKRRTCRRDSGSPQGQPGRSESIDPPSLTEIKLPGRYISVRTVIHLTVALWSVDSSVSADMRSLIFAAVSWFCKSSAYASWSRVSRALWDWKNLSWAYQVDSIYYPLPEHRDTFVIATKLVAEWMQGVQVGKSRLWNAFQRLDNIQATKAECAEWQNVIMKISQALHLIKTQASCCCHFEIEGQRSIILWKL